MVDHLSPAARAAHHHRLNAALTVRAVPTTATLPASSWWLDLSRAQFAEQAAREAHRMRYARTWITRDEDGRRG